MKQKSDIKNFILEGFDHTDHPANWPAKVTFLAMAVLLILGGLIGGLCYLASLLE